MSDDRGFSSASIALSFILGGVLGASLALLLAPEPGRRTRERIRALASEIKDKTSDIADDLRDRVEETLDQGRDVLEEKKSILTAAFQAGREAMQREKQRLQAE